jgi:predicted AAA+ superfamily ATPase
MKTDQLYPRFADQRLERALEDSPVVLIHGPRQSGKTTFARTVGGRLGYAYYSFDDQVLAGAAEADPIGFVDGLPERAILDEVQRVPGVFPALKMAVDQCASGAETLRIACRQDGDSAAPSVIAV